MERPYHYCQVLPTGLCVENLTHIVRDDVCGGCWVGLNAGAFLLPVPGHSVPAETNLIGLLHLPRRARIGAVRW
jgi:hypothetical protein